MSVLGEAQASRSDPGGRDSHRKFDRVLEGERVLEDLSYDVWAADIRRMAEQRKAIILAHNYQLPWIQDVADHVGDSLALSRIAARSDAEVIVFCGVHFMAETAKILAPNRTVLLPALGAGCSLADTVDAAQVRDWKTKHPNGFVVAYVNTSAAVKAESDICCTSANAVDVVQSLPLDAEILFLPDFFLGSHVIRQTGRSIELWMGECHVHAGISPVQLRKKVEEDPSVELFIHPECGCSSTALHLLDEGQLPLERTHILSTGSMVDMAKQLGEGRALVGTETGILHQLRAANPLGTFEAVDDRAICPYMKMITPQVLTDCLRYGINEITVPEDIRTRAAAAVEAMISIGAASSPSR